MKVIVLLGIFSIGLANCETVLDNNIASIHDSEEDITFVAVMTEVQDYMDKKCAASGSTETRNYTEILYRILHCSDSYVPKSVKEMQIIGKADSSDEVCGGVEKSHKIRECFQPAIDILKDCSSAEEKYLPEFLFDAVKNVFNAVCAEEGKNVEKFYQNNTKECFGILISSEEHGIDVCRHKKDSFGLNADDSILTKKELCNGLREYKICLADFMNKKCSNNSNLRELWEDFMDAIIGPCSK